MLYASNMTLNISSLLHWKIRIFSESAQTFKRYMTIMEQLLLTTLLCPIIDLRSWWVYCGHWSLLGSCSPETSGGARECWLPLDALHSTLQYITQFRSEVTWWCKTDSNVKSTDPYLIEPQCRQWPTTLVLRASIDCVSVSDYPGHFSQRAEGECNHISYYSQRKVTKDTF